MKRDRAHNDVCLVSSSCRHDTCCLAAGTSLNTRAPPAKVSKLFDEAEEAAHNASNGSEMVTSLVGPDALFLPVRDVAADSKAAENSFTINPFQGSGSHISPDTLGQTAQSPCGGFAASMAGRVQRSLLLKYAHATDDTGKGRKGSRQLTTVWLFAHVNVEMLIF